MHGFFRWSSKWWPGTIPLVILWAFAAWSSTAPLESDLGQRTTAALKDTVLDKTKIAVAGRDVTFSAEAFSEDGRRSAVAAVDAVPGVRLVNDDTRLVPEAKPFVWSAERDVVRVTLGGSTPLPATKGRLLDAARASLSGVEVADRMGLARGAPPRFDAAALLLIDQIGKLKEGKITVVAQAGPRAPDLAAPSVEDAARTPEERRIIELVVSGTQLGRPLATNAAPPDRVAALRAAYAATMKDPEFLAEAKSLNFEVSPVLGEPMQRIVEKVLSTPKELTTKAKGLME